LRGGKFPFGFAEAGFDEIERRRRHREPIRQPLQNPKPPIRGLAARRDASGGFGGRRRRFLGLALGTLGHD
jgi:hypothetical protein